MGVGAVAIGAGSAALGSIVSQGIGVASGIQQSFSWKGVALAALSGGAAAGLAGNGEWLAAAARGAATSAITQGIGVVTGLQDKFDWAGVAAAGIGAGAAAGVGSISGVRSIGSVAGRFTTSMAADIADAATRSVINGTDFGDNVLAALPDVLGQTIGGLIADGVSGRGTSDPTAGTSEGAESQPAPGEDGGQVGGPNYITDPIVFDPIDLGPDFSTYLMTPGELNSAYFAAGGDPFERRAEIKGELAAAMGLGSAVPVSEVPGQREVRVVNDLDLGILATHRAQFDAEVARTGRKPGDDIYEQAYDVRKTQIMELDQRVNAQLAQDLRDFGRIYYNTAATVIAPIGLADTAYHALNGDLSVAEAAIAVATMGKGRVLGTAEKMGANGAERVFSGGAFGRLSAGSGIERHHLPASGAYGASPFTTRYSGPAIQMERADHILTASHGFQGLEGALYRSEIKGLLESGRMRSAMAIEIRDVRRVAVEGGGSITKYNPAIRQMLDYSYQKNWLIKR